MTKKEKTKETSANNNGNISHIYSFTSQWVLKNMRSCSYNAKNMYALLIIGHGISNGVILKAILKVS